VDTESYDDIIIGGGKAGKTLGRTDGLLKAIVDAKTDRILGCSLLCHSAGEMISTVQMVMQAQMPYTVLRDGVLTHPTMTEGLNLLFSKL
jgi:probable pyridine nucleotide-disulfide oxidoreductase